MSDLTEREARMQAEVALLFEALQKQRQFSDQNFANWQAAEERLRAVELDAAAHRYCVEAITASPAPESTTSEGIYWLTEKLAEAQEGLRAVEALAKSRAVIARARWHTETERDWLDVLAIIDRAALASPVESDAEVQP